MPTKGSGKLRHFGLQLKEVETLFYKLPSPDQRAAVDLFEDALNRLLMAIGDSGAGTSVLATAPVSRSSVTSDHLSDVPPEVGDNQGHRRRSRASKATRSEVNAKTRLRPRREKSSSIKADEGQELESRTRDAKRKNPHPKKLRTQKELGQSDLSVGSAPVPQKTRSLAMAKPQGERLRRSHADIQLFPSMSFKEEKTDDSDTTGIAALFPAIQENEEMNLLVHYKIESGQEPKRQDLDDKGNSSDSTVSTDGFVEVGAGPVAECTVCNVVFTSTKTLKKHRLTFSHTSKAGEAPAERTYLCSECGKAYFRPQALKRHMRYHTDDKPHSCDHCGFRCRERHNLKRHVALHFSERNFVCELCGAAFHAKNTLNAHTVYKHTEERRYQCTECKQSFKTRDSLRCHARTHGDGKTLTCKECHSTFSRVFNLRRHMTSMHGCGVGSVPPPRRVKLLDVPAGMEYAKGPRVATEKPPVTPDSELQGSILAVDQPQEQREVGCPESESVVMAEETERTCAELVRGSGRGAEDAPQSHGDGQRLPPAEIFVMASSLGMGHTYSPSMATVAQVDEECQAALTLATDYGEPKSVAGPQLLMPGMPTSMLYHHQSHGALSYAIAGPGQRILSGSLQRQGQAQVPATSVNGQTESPTSSSQHGMRIPISSQNTIEQNLFLTMQQQPGMDHPFAPSTGEPVLSSSHLRQQRLHPSLVVPATSDQAVPPSTSQQLDMRGPPLPLPGDRSNAMTFTTVATRQTIPPLAMAAGPIVHVITPDGPEQQVHLASIMETAVGDLALQSTAATPRTDSAYFSSENYVPYTSIP